MFDAVIFDLDGTLVNSEAVLVEASLRIYRARGHAVDLDLFHSMIGVDDVGSAKILRQALGESVDLDAIHQEIRTQVRASFTQDGVPLQKGAREILQALHDIGMPMALATSSRHESAHWKLNRAGLAGYFQTVVSRDDVTAPKPAPDAYLLAAQRLGVAPIRCLVFEDSDPGAIAGRRAGMTVVQVPDVLAPQGDYATIVAPDLMTGARQIGLLR